MLTLDSSAPCRRRRARATATFRWFLLLLIRAPSSPSPSFSFSSLQTSDLSRFPSFFSRWFQRSDEHCRRRQRRRFCDKLRSSRCRPPPRSHSSPPSPVRKEGARCITRICYIFETLHSQWCSSFGACCTGLWLGTTCCCYVAQLPCQSCLFTAAEVESGRKWDIQIEGNKK